MPIRLGLNMHVDGRRRNGPAAEAKFPPARDTCPMIAGDLVSCL
jgi:hypothetical protein